MRIAPSVLGELGVAETHTDAAAAAEHLSQAIDELERSDAAPETSCSPTRTSLNLFGQTRPGIG